MATTHYLYVSFDDPGTADNARTWVDISSRIRSTDGNAGRDSELEAFDALQASLSLDNRDRALDPTNSASTYAPNIVPNRMLWYQVDVDGTLFDVFKGYVNGWNPDWDEVGVGDFRAKPRLTDRTKLLTLGNFTAASPDVLDYEDVISADEPSFYYRLGEPAGTKVVHHARKKRKRREHEGRRHYHRHGFKRWTTQRTRAEAEGISGPAGVYKNTPTLGAQGLIAGDSDTAVLFTAASSEYASVAVDSSEAIDGNELTLECWFKPTTVTGLQGLIGSGTFSGTGDSSFALMVASGILRLRVVHAGVATSYDGSVTLSAGSVYHLVATWAGGPVANVYVNGVLDTSLASSGSLSAPDSEVAFYIGRSKSSGTFAYANGVIDEVAIYETGLSADRIQAHYEAGLLGFDSATTGGRILQTLKLHAPQEFQDGTFSGNEITDATRTTNTQGDGRPFRDLEFYGDFEAATVGAATGFDSLEAFSAADQFTTVTSPLRLGTKAGKFIVRSGDTVSGGERCEVTRQTGFGTGDARGQTVYGGFSLRPEGAWQHPTGWEIPHQVHAFESDFGQPPMRLQVNGARTHWEWRLVTGTFPSSAAALAGTSAGVNLSFDLLPFDDDVWFDFRYAVKWTTDSTGWVVVEMKQSTDTAWQRLVEQRNIQTLPTYSGGPTPTIYYKWGLYRNASAFTNVLYQDAIWMGHSLADDPRESLSPNEGTTGIWPSATNLIQNGGFETNTTSWATNGAGASISRVTSEHFFGTAALKLDMTGAASSESAQYQITLTNGTVYTFQTRVKAAAGQRYRVWVVDSLSATLVTKTFTGDGDWHWHYVIFTGNANQPHRLRIGRTATGSAETLYIDGAQLETGDFPSPYVHTDGGSASRSAARVQIPTTNLDETQGWVAGLVRLGWASTSAFATNPYVFCWRDDDSNEIRLRYETGTDTWVAHRRTGGSGTSASSAAVVFARGDQVVVIAAWDSTHVKVSVDGGAFVSAADTNIPTLAATTMDVGSSIGTSNHIAGDVKWLAWGKGAFTDTDAARVYAEGPWTPALSDKKGLTVWDGWRTSSSPWHIDPGTRTMPPARYAGLPPKELIEDAVAAEGDPARFYISKGGFPTYLDATHRGRGYWSNPRYVFGAGTGEIPFQELTLSDEDAYLYNDIRATREEGDQTFQATDATSISSYGLLVLPLDSVPLADDTEIQAFVDDTLSRYKDPMTRISSFVVIGTTAAIRQVILSLEIGDQVMIRWQPSQGGSLIEQVSYVERRKISGVPDIKVVGEFSVSPR